MTTNTPPSTTKDPSELTFKEKLARAKTQAQLALGNISKTPSPKASTPTNTKPNTSAVATPTTASSSTTPQLSIRQRAALLEKQNAATAPTPPTSSNTATQTSTTNTPPKIQCTPTNTAVVTPEATMSSSVISTPQPKTTTKQKMTTVPSAIDPLKLVGASAAGWLANLEQQQVDTKAQEKERYEAISQKLEKEQETKDKHNQAVKKRTEDAVTEANKRLAKIVGLSEPPATGQASPISSTLPCTTTTSATATPLKSSTDYRVKPILPVTLDRNYRPTEENSEDDLESEQEPKKISTQAPLPPPITNPSLSSVLIPPTTLTTATSISRPQTKVPSSSPTQKTPATKLNSAPLPEPKEPLLAKIASQITEAQDLYRQIRANIQVVRSRLKDTGAFSSELEVASHMMSQFSSPSTQLAHQSPQQIKDLTEQNSRTLQQLRTILSNIQLAQMPLPKPSTDGFGDEEEAKKALQKQKTSQQEKDDACKAMRNLLDFITTQAKPISLDKKSLKGSTHYDLMLCCKNIDQRPVRLPGMPEPEPTFFSDQELLEDLLFAIAQYLDKPRTEHALNMFRKQIEEARNLFKSQIANLKAILQYLPYADAKLIRLPKNTVRSLFQTVMSIINTPLTIPSNTPPSSGSGSSITSPPTPSSASTPTRTSAQSSSPSAITSTTHTTSPSTGTASSVSSLASLDLAIATLPPHQKAIYKILEAIQKQAPQKQNKKLHRILFQVFEKIQTNNLISDKNTSPHPLFSAESKILAKLICNLCSYIIAENRPADFSSLGKHLGELKEYIKNTPPGSENNPLNEEHDFITQLLARDTNPLKSASQQYRPSMATLFDAAILLTKEPNLARFTWSSAQNRIPAASSAPSTTTSSSPTSTPTRTSPPSSPSSSAPSAAATTSPANAQSLVASRIGIFSGPSTPTGSHQSTYTRPPTSVISTPTKK